MLNQGLLGKWETLAEHDVDDNIGWEYFKTYGKFAVRYECLAQQKSRKLFFKDN